MSVHRTTVHPESRVHERYLRHTKKFPNIWCAGCGNGIVLGAIIRAVDELGLDKNEVAMISGIGCSGRMPVYVDFNTMHTTHGRALAFATGLKMVRPWMKILVIMGDGDALAIGGNHFIHAARRNIGLTAIVINNQIYGMTGGQYSPTTPTDARATTAPYGHIEQPFPITELAQAAGAAYVARSTIYHVRELQRYIAQAISKDGFSVVEAVSYCHTTFGRQNKLGRATDMMHHIQEHSVTLATASEMGEDERKLVIVRGVLVDRDIPEYTRLYEKTIVKAQTQARHQDGSHQMVRQAESDRSAARPGDTTEQLEDADGTTTPMPSSLLSPTELSEQPNSISQDQEQVAS